MESFIVSARKYRPATFDTVVGQHSITTTLKNAIRNNHLAQAYLFCGPRGVGKTTCARIFARTINCFNVTAETEACGVCESCKSFSESRSFNIHELDAASNNSVEDIRNLIDQVRIPPQVGNFSIYIIDEVHMLSNQAFNAFLKTLEEPPRHAVFILATTEKHKIIPTILSRCQIFDFNRIQIDDTVKFLEKIAKNENIDYEVDALTIVAQKSDGGMRDALSIFDQIASFSSNKITYKNVIENLNILDYDYYFKLVDAFLNGNVAETFNLFNEVISNGFDAHNFINGLSKHLRDLLICKDSSTLQLLEVGQNIKEKYKQQSALCTADFIFDALTICNQCDINFRLSKNQRLHVELGLVQLSQILNNKKKTELDNAVAQPKAEYQPQVKPNPTESQSTATSASTPSNTTPPAPKQTISQMPSFSIKPVVKQENTDKPQTNDKDIVQKESTIQEVSKTSTNEVFTISQLQDVFLQFTETIKDTKQRMYNALATQKPELNAKGNIVIQLNNEGQRDDFEKTIKNDLLRYLKNELKNDTLSIEIEIMETEPQNLLYSAEDKYNHMVTKNPTLAKLRQQFNLDFD